MSQNDAGEPSRERTHRQRWDDYLYPDTGVLRNKFDLTDPSWSRVEAELVSLREVDLPEFGFDAGHLADELRKIHHTIFQDCYEWAGEWRDVDMSKEHPVLADSAVTFTSWEAIEDNLDVIQSRMEATPWDDLGTTEKIEALAKVHAQLNAVHPFREGNGRTTRAYMETLAARHDIELDWTDAKHGLHLASAASMMHESGLSFEPWIALYGEIAQQATWDSQPIPDIGDLLARMGVLDLEAHRQETGERSERPPAPQAPSLERGHSYEW